jgi:hypothetical protein
MAHFSRNHFQFLPLVLLCWSIGILVSACDSSTPPPSPSTSGSSTSPKGGSTPKNGNSPDDPSEEDDSDIPPEDFDLCSTGLLVNSRLKEFTAYTKAICSESQLQALRKPESIFSGGENKIIEKARETGDKSSKFTLMTSAVYQTDIESYWAMLRLQFLKPKVYADNFERDENTTVSEVEPASDNSSVTFRYENSTGEGGKVDYLAKTELIQLAKGLAYTVATKLTQSKETLTDIKGLIVVHKIDDESVEVFTTSFQEYSHAPGQGKTYYDRALNSMKEEQKRTWRNAKNAGNAKPLLGQ